MSTTGGCQCGNIKYSYEGEPAAVALCHCIPCRRSSNSAYSTNIIVPGPSFHLTAGTPNKWTRTGDSGGSVTNHFCGECGTLLYVVGDALVGVTIIKSGTLDDLSLVDKMKPSAELYCKNKYGWLPDIEGVHKFEAAMSG